MKAIQVKYLPPTNTKGSRFKAFAYGGASVVISMDYGLNPDDNARNAAEKLREKYNYKAEVSGFGCLANGDSVFTLSHK